MTQATTHLHTPPGDVDYAVNLHDVSKVYSRTLFRRKGIHALRGVEMRVNRGEIFGLLGPNGAGKSTLVKILMSVIRATGATGSVLGRPIGDKATLAKVGYLPEHHKFPDYLTGEQILQFYGAMCGVQRRERQQRSGELLALVGMSDWRRTRVREYSKGMRQRIGIAQALMNNPELVVLDEPTDGVDPVGRRDIRAMMTTLKDRGMTVILNSHLLTELEMVCDRVAILVKGKVVSQGTIDELTFARRHIEIEIVTDKDPYITLVSAGGVAATARSGAPMFLSSGESVQIERNIMKVMSGDVACVQPVIDRLRAENVTIRALRPIRPTLEDLFMEAVLDPTTGKALTPGAIDAPAIKGGEQ
jgi:ABC-2 type transport system ATP-binding protein